MLAILLFINSGGFIILFYSQQLSIKEGISSSIRRGDFTPSEIIYFTFNKDFLYKNKDVFLWNDKNEFEYKGKMYDVIKLVEKDSVCVLSCLNDISEEKILKSFAGEFNRLVTDNPKDSKTRTCLFNLISQALIYNKFELFPSFKQKKLNQLYWENISSSEIEIPSPPPKQC